MLKIKIFQRTHSATTALLTIFLFMIFMSPTYVLALPIDSGTGSGSGGGGGHGGHGGHGGGSSDENSDDGQFKRKYGQGNETCGSEGNPGNENKGVPISIKVGCKGSANPIYAYVKGLIPIIAAGVGLVVVGTILVGAIMYASARDDTGQAEQAKMLIFSATIALIMFLLMAAILNFIVPGGIV